MDSATKVLLTFHESAVKDECGNIWTPIGNPTIGAANSKFGSALQLDGQSGIVMQDGIELGGDDFTIDFWMYLEKYEGLQGTLIDSTYRIPADSDSDSDSESYRFVRLERAYDKNDLLCHISSTCPPTAFNDWADGQLSLSWLFDYGDLGEINWNNEIYEKVMHVALIYSHTNHFFGIFINGALEQIAYCNCERQRVNSVYIGCDSDTSNFIVGSISEFRISDGAARWITDENNKLPFSVTWTEDFYVIDGAPEDWDGGSPWFLFDPPMESAHETYQNKDRVGCDTLRQLTDGHWERGRFDTLRHIIAGHERAGIDTARRIIARVAVDTARQVSKRQRTFADTVINVPLILNYYRAPTVKKAARKYNASNPAAIELENDTSLVNTFKDVGVVSFDIQLNEHTLSDQYTLKIINPRIRKFVEDAGSFVRTVIAGRLFDYEFEFTTENVSFQGAEVEFSGQKDVDKLQYTPIFLDLDYDKQTGAAHGINSKLEFLNWDPFRSEEEKEYHPVGDYVQGLAKTLDMEGGFAGDSFTPYADFTQSNISCYDMISSLFSWTTSFPWRQVNVYIRGNRLICQQRGAHGRKAKGYDISRIRHSEPRFERQIFRTLFNNAYQDADDDEESVPFTGTIKFKDDASFSSLHYKKGLLLTEHSETVTEFSPHWPVWTPGAVRATTVSDISYTYKSLDNNYYLDSKKEISVSLEQEAKGDDEDELLVRYNTVTQAWSTVTSAFEYSHTVDGEILLHDVEEKTVRVVREWEAKEPRTGVGKEDEEEEDEEEEDVIELPTTETTLRRTHYVPLGNGFFGASVSINGFPQGGTIHQGNPSSAVSLYTVKQAQSVLHDFGYNQDVVDTGDVSDMSDAADTSDVSDTSDAVDTSDVSDSKDSDSDNFDVDDTDKPRWGENWDQLSEEDYETLRRRLSPIMDMSIPIRDLDLINQIRHEAMAYNRCVQEILSLTLYTPIKNGVAEHEHIIDFSDIVIFNERYYELVSNQVSLTPHQLTQSLRLLRWVF